MKHSIQSVLLFCFVFTTISSRAQITEITSFGTNPGNLKMFLFEPSVPKTNAEVVLVMHGCLQEASDFANETGWNVLAEEFGFYVIYAEQKPINNPSRCFNWFRATDQIRNSGESQSLMEMIEYVHNTYSTDPNKSFVCGLSAGGSMTSVMMACYPDKIVKGGIWAGVPYLYKPPGGMSLSAFQWGDSVRSAYPGYTGTFPKLFVCQGTIDNIVDPVNENDLMLQWTNVNNADSIPDLTTSNFQGNTSVTEKIYLNNGLTDTVVITYTINGMGHGIAVDPGTGATQGGQTSGGAYDVNFYSTYWMACFFDLIPHPTNNIEEESNPTVTVGSLQDGAVKLTLSDLNEKMTLYLMDVNGRLIHQTHFHQEITLSSDMLPNTPFLVLLQNSNGVRVFQQFMVKQEK